MDGRPSPGPWRHRRVWLVPALRPAVFGGLDDPADRRAVLDWARAGRPFIGRGALPGDAPGGLPLGLALPPQPHKRRLSLTEDYNSHNTRRLDVAEMKQMLLRLEFMQRIARGEAAEPED